MWFYSLENSQFRFSIFFSKSVHVDRCIRIALMCIALMCIARIDGVSLLDFGAVRVCLAQKHKKHTYSHRNEGKKERKNLTGFWVAWFWGSTGRRTKMEIVFFETDTVFIFRENKHGNIGVRTLESAVRAGCLNSYYFQVTGSFYVDFGCHRQHRDTLLSHFTHFSNPAISKLKAPLQCKLWKGYWCGVVNGMVNDMIFFVIPLVG